VKKVMFCIPPIKSTTGHATACQNRQFSFLKDPFFAYPIVPALAITMLQNAGHSVSWCDSLAERLNDVDFARAIVTYHPEYIIFESPTPIIKQYWEVINGLKLHLPDIKIILCGAHVTALSEESHKNCKADYVVTGGDWHYKVFEIIHGKEWDIKSPLPQIDRNTTKWWLYAYQNGNFKYLPGTYIMSGMDCWYGKCKFCSWATYHSNYYLRQPGDVLDEIDHLTNAGFKEIFDDSGTFPTGPWLKEFCEGMIKRELPQYISFGCNMRFSALQEEDYALMAKAGFRFILWGLESANQKTLDRLDKGYKTTDIAIDLARAKKAGLESHLTVMFGYPWESLQEAKVTYNLARKLLIKGMAESAQATICIPYPGTPLWKECKEQGLLTTENWALYDMSRAIMKVPYPEKELFKMQRGIYNTSFHPEFLLRKLGKVKTLNDLKYYLRIARKVYDRFGNSVGFDRPCK
jgi:anaerobic magnesium-protoporphyrin IX monomethyl ester cyclase